MVVGDRHPVGTMAMVVALTLPWLGLRAAGATASVGTVGTILLSGVAVIGAAFILTWAAEAAELDVPRAFALAVLAVIAVAPEYAVDALYAWEAGVAPGTPASENAANLAVANMTGANRILIGLGWSLIALYAIFRKRDRADVSIDTGTGPLAGAVTLERRIAIEVVFLAAATGYAFFIPFNGGIGALDAVVLVGLYAAYVAVILRGVPGTEIAGGVPGYLHRFTRRRRIVTILAMFAFSAAAILLAVKPFAKGLEVLGPQLGVSSFFMIQWVAPLASESPEFIATAYLVRKFRTTAAFNALISSKLNQWTLLIGTLVVVYSLSLGRYGVLAFNDKQAAEIWLTAAQSFFAITLLIDFRISTREALALLGLFAFQFLPPFQDTQGLLMYSAGYVVLGLGVLWVRRGQILTLLREARRQAQAATDGPAGPH